MTSKTVVVPKRKDAHVGLSRVCEGSMCEDHASLQSAYSLAEHVLCCEPVEWFLLDSLFEHVMHDAESALEPHKN